MNIYYPDSSNISAWTEWHLTPLGWERGNQRQENSTQVKQVEAPLDRVLTCRYHENVTINSVWMQKHTIELWRDSEELVDKLIEKFGFCPESL
ncbi:hypothetical protein NIES4071_08950 [Calothrix sp. NIES-4071]|nr:hypothetical protein NIES4071_08950 [Calothrix sp. NIES-4071]BAZ55237.1 hypothetical protein NIES4105_08910 [Calothrix sp. NIES-4105]